MTQSMPVVTGRVKFYKHMNSDDSDITIIKQLWQKKAKTLLYAAWM